MNTQVGQNICHSLAVNLPKWPFSTHCYEVAQIYEPGRNSMDLINRKFPQIQGLPLSTPQPTFSVQWPRYASTILLLKPCIKIPKDMVQTSRAALLSFFQSQKFSTILFPIFLKRIFQEWLYCVNQACGSLTHFPLWETMVTENAFLRSSRGQPFRHWEEFRLRLRVLPAASKRGYSYGHQWSFITVFGLWAHMVVCRQFNAPSPCAPWHALSSKLGGQCEINAQIRWKQNL